MDFTWIKPLGFHRFPPDHDCTTTDDVCTISFICVTSSIFFFKTVSFLRILLERVFFKTLALFSSLSLFDLTITVERRSGLYLKTDICSQIPVCSCYSVSRMLSTPYWPGKGSIIKVLFFSFLFFFFFTRSLGRGMTEYTEWFTNIPKSSSNKQQCRKRSIYMDETPIFRL